MGDERVSTEQDEQQPFPERLSFSGLLLAALGIGVSFYSLLHHLQVKSAGFSDFSCNINASVSCDTVARSAYSEIAGMPLAVFGLGYFLGILVLAGMAYQKKQTRSEGLSAYVLLVFSGVLVSLVLGVISWFYVHSLCLVCLSVYLITFLLLLSLWLDRDYLRSIFSWKGSINGLSAPGFAMLVALVGYSFYPREPSRAPILSVEEQRELAKGRLELPTLDLEVARSVYSGAGEDYRKGPDTAKIVIVEFADFQCPGCRYAAEVLQKIEGEFKGQVQIVFKNFPLSSECNPTISSNMHPFACEAAFHGRCVGETGHFWDYANLVFSNQSQLTKQKIRDFALTTGMSPSDLDYCLSSRRGELKSKIEADINLGQRIGVRGTPAIYINGKVYNGPATFETLSEYLRSLEL